MNNNQNTYSLESLKQLKADKRLEIEESKDRMSDLVHDMMTPPPVKNNMELWMHYASNGMAAYRGLITCIKLVRRLKGTFTRKKKKSRSIFS